MENLKVCSRGITVQLMGTNINEIKSSDLLQFEIRRHEYEIKSGLLFVAKKYLPLQCH